MYDQQLGDICHPHAAKIALKILFESREEKRRGSRARPCGFAVNQMKCEGLRQSSKALTL